MHCMKCGSEIDEGQVFCIQCLKDMEKYPVRPGTAVHLPRRANTPLRRSVPKRKPLTSEEVEKRLRRRIRRLSLALILTTLLAALLAFPAVQYFLSIEHFSIGQNYTVIQDLLPSEEPNSNVSREADNVR